MCRFTSDAKDRPSRESWHTLARNVYTVRVRMRMGVEWESYAFNVIQDYAAIMCFVRNKWTKFHCSILCNCACFLSDAANTNVAISTYSMVSYTQKRAWDSQQVISSSCYLCMPLSLNSIHVAVLFMVSNPGIGLTMAVSN